MKKPLLTLFLCSLLLSVYAQPSLLSSEMLPFGSVMNQKTILNFNVIDTTIQGANATWNFSALQPNTTVVANYVTIANPSQTPYGASFPTANYAYIEGPATAYRYFNLTPAKMERVGSYFSNLNTFNDPQTEYVFPLALGVSNNDTWDNTNSSFGGTYDLTCIGYGTLVLPSGSYNALMVRVMFDEGGLLVFTNYFWYSSDNGAILIQYTAGDGTFVPEQGRYLTSFTTAINENELVDNLYYNNPVQNNLQLHFTCKEPVQLHYTLTNSVGETVLAGEYAATTTLQQLDIDFNHFAQGFYFLSLRSDNSSDKAKTIKLVKM